MKFMNLRFYEEIVGYQKFQQKMLHLEKMTLWKNLRNRDRKFIKLLTTKDRKTIRDLCSGLHLEELSQTFPILEREFDFDIDRTEEFCYAMKTRFGMNLSRKSMRKFKKHFGRKWCCSTFVRMMSFFYSNKMLMRLER